MWEQCVIVLFLYEYILDIGLSTQVSLIPSSPTAWASHDGYLLASGDSEAEVPEDRVARCVLKVDVVKGDGGLLGAH